MRRISICQPFHHSLTYSSSSRYATHLWVHWTSRSTCLKSVYLAESPRVLTLAATPKRMRVNAKRIKQTEAYRETQKGGGRILRKFNCFCEILNKMSQKVAFPKQLIYVINAPHIKIVSAPPLFNVPLEVKYS